MCGKTETIFKADGRKIWTDGRKSPIWGLCGCSSPCGTVYSFIQPSLLAAVQAWAKIRETQTTKSPAWAYLAVSHTRSYYSPRSCAILLRRAREPGTWLGGVAGRQAGCLVVWSTWLSSTPTQPWGGFNMGAWAQCRKKRHWGLAL